MPKFGSHSKEQLATCHQDLIKIANKAIKLFDFTVVEGYRGKDLQNKYYEEGKSLLKYPHSKHNKKPSLAFDLCPYVDGLVWERTELFYQLAGIILTIADYESIPIVWGGHWKTFKDLPHFEIRR